MRQGSSLRYRSTRWSTSRICRVTALGRRRYELISTQVRVPLADGTVMKAPEEIQDNVLVLMADIFPTGMLSGSFDCYVF